MADETAQSPVKTANAPANDTIDAAREAREKAAEYRRQEQQLEQRAREEVQLFREQRAAAWELERRLEAAKATVESSERQVQYLEGTVQPGQARIAELQQQIKDHPERAADLRDDLERVQDSVTYSQSLLTQRREALQQARTEVESLRGEYEKAHDLARESWERWDATLKEAQEAEDAARQVEGAEQRFEEIEALREDADRFTATAATVREDVDAARDALAEAARENARLGTEEADAKTDLEEAGRRLQNITDSRSAYEKGIEEKERKAVELERKGDLRGAEELREEVEQDRHTVTVFLAGRESELRLQIDEANQRLKDIEQKAASAERAHEEALARHDGLEKFADQLEDKSRFLRESAAWREEVVESRILADRYRAEAETKTGSERDALLSSAEGLEDNAKVMEASATASLQKSMEIDLDNPPDPKYLKLLEPGLDDSAAGASTGLLTDPTAMDESTIAMATAEELPPEEGAAGADERQAVPAVMGDGSDLAPAGPEVEPVPAAVGAAELGAEPSGEYSGNGDAVAAGEMDPYGAVAPPEMDPYEPVAASTDPDGYSDPAAVSSPDGFEETPAADSYQDPVVADAGPPDDYQELS